MKVTLLNMTSNARELLMMSKNTRLQMKAENLQTYIDMPEAQKIDELQYMEDTIRSSWEFVDFIFMIEDVSRAFTHQFVRNRQGSYAQQTMRVLDVSGFDYHVGKSLEHDAENLERYCEHMAETDQVYKDLIRSGVKVEDARGVLPTDIHTNIMVKYNLRTLSDLMQSRASHRTQGEFREVLEQMYEEVLKQAPWARGFLKNHKSDAADRLESEILSAYEGSSKLMHLIKLIDVLRK